MINSDILYKCRGSFQIFTLKWSFSSGYFGSLNDFFKASSWCEMNSFTNFTSERQDNLIRIPVGDIICRHHSLTPSSSCSSRDEEISQSGQLQDQENPIRPDRLHPTTINELTCSCSSWPSPSRIPLRRVCAATELRLFLIPLHPLGSFTGN